MMSQCFGGSLWREGSLRAVCVGGSLDSVLVARFGDKAVYGPCVGGSLVAVFWWLALARKQFTGRLCWWGAYTQSSGGSLVFFFFFCLIARVVDEAVFGSGVLVGATSQHFAGFLWR